MELTPSCGWPRGRRVRHSPGLEFPDDPERRSRSIPVLPGKVCLKEGQELVQGHTARTEVCTRVLGLQGPAELPQTRSSLRPGPAPVTLGVCAARPLDGSLGLRRTARAAGAPRVPRPRSEGLAGGLASCSSEALPLAPKPRVTGSK